VSIEMVAVMYPVETPSRRGAGVLPGPAAPARRRPRAASRCHRSAATYWRRRIVAVGIALGTVLTAAHAGAALGGSPLTASGRRPHVVTHIVQPGDTLWKIAGELDPKADPREIVDELVAARHTTSLVPGETIVWLGN
jgi:nucleoid-associated protein YgaU